LGFVFWGFWGGGGRGGGGPDFVYLMKEAVDGNRAEWEGGQRGKKNLFWDFEFEKFYFS